MNGCQFADFTNIKPRAMKSTITDTLVITIMLLKFADSRIPITSSVEISATMNIAGTLRMHVT
jgi:hypothetical protein